MSAFDLKENSRYAADPAMTNCSGPILFDASSIREMLIRYTPTQGTAQSLGAGPTCYNDTEIKFHIQFDTGSRVRFDKSYLKIDYVALNVGVSPATKVDEANVSIPWNTIAAMFSTAYYQLNSTNQTVERYDANWQHGNMIKVLTSYTRAALEEARDRFFTPCIESIRDTGGALSAESVARATAAFKEEGTTEPKYGSKIVMLSDLFDSLTTETACYAQVFQLYLRFKAPNAILFQTTAATGTNNLYVVGLQLYMMQNVLSEVQVDQMAALVKENLPVIRNSYRRFDTYIDTHNTSKSYVTTGIKNLQAAVLMFPSTTSTDLTGINPYQYCYGSRPTPNNNTGISMYQHRYGPHTYPMSSQTVELINKGKNTDVYEHWRTLCRTINDKMYTPSIPFAAMSRTDSNGPDSNPYVFFPAVFCNQDAAPMKLAAGADHEIMTSGGNAGIVGVVVRVRVNAYSIDGHGTVTVMD